MAPMLMSARVIGLFVEDLSEADGRFLGVNEVQFGAPAHPGDTIIRSSKVLQKRESASRPEARGVTWRTTAKKHNGEMICLYTRTNPDSVRRPESIPHRADR